jgi:hypothetical protein
VKPPSLESMVQGARVPERTDDYWNDFPGLVVRRIQAGEMPSDGRRPWRLAAGLATAVACGLVLGFALWHRAPPSGGADVNLRDGRVLREFLARYPGRLRAVIQDGGGLHAQFSDAVAVSTSDPIWLEIREGRELRVIATFSGQVVQCGGKNVMVLSDGGGHVMLVGEGFFWSREVSAGVAGNVRIRAEQIPKAQAPTRAPTPL